MVTSGYAAPEYEHHLNRRHELAQSLNDTTQIFYSLVGMSVLSAFRLELNRARDIGWELLGIAENKRDPNMQFQAHGSLANVLWQLGDIPGSREHAEKALNMYPPERHLTYDSEHWWAACQFYSCASMAALGFPDRGLRQALEFLKRSRERAHLISLVFALNSVASVLAWRGEAAEALKYASDLFALTAEHGFGNWNSIARLTYGQALALLGRADEAIAEINTALDSYEATGAVAPGWAYADLALAFLAAKQPEDGMKAAAKGLAVGASSGGAEAKTELHRLYGELLLMGDPAKAAEGEKFFREAIEVAREQSCKFHELLATLSLARLLKAQNRRGEARAMLAEIYNWFTEGFGTRDLQEARQLLNELDREF
jgi:predicted ATPase